MLSTLWVPERLRHGMCGLYKSNNLGGTMGGLNILQFFALYQGAVVIWANLEPCIRTW